MHFVDAYYRLVNWPSQQVLLLTFAGGVALLLIAAIILGFGKARRFARGVGIVGLLVIMLALAIVPQQTIPMGSIGHRVLTRPRYSYQSRLYATAALIAVPSAGAAVMLAVLLKTRRRLRALAPRYLKAGRREFIRKEYAAALREFNRAIKLSPLIGEAYCQRGLALLAMGDNTHALADFDQAIELDPRLSTAYIERGRIRTENGEFERALDDFRQALGIRSNDPECYLCRGVCMMKQGLWTDAAADFHRVLKLTNHSDFAEPAKTYLREIEARAHSIAPTPGSNGSTGSNADVLPKPEDQLT